LAQRDSPPGFHRRRYDRIAIRANYRSNSVMSTRNVGLDNNGSLRILAKALIHVHRMRVAWQVFRRHESPISPIRRAFSGVCGSLPARGTLVPVEPLMTPAVGLHPSTKTGGMPRKWIAMPLCYNLKLKQNSLPETDSPPSDAEAISNLRWNHGVRSTGHGHSTVIAESLGNLISAGAATHR
jgi:hypothetical protein